MNKFNNIRRLKEYSIKYLLVFSMFFLTIDCGFDKKSESSTQSLSYRCKWTACYLAGVTASSQCKWTTASKIITGSRTDCHEGHNSTAGVKYWDGGRFSEKFIDCGLAKTRSSCLIRRVSFKTPGKYLITAGAGIKNEDESGTYTLHGEVNNAFDCDNAVTECLNYPRTVTKSCTYRVSCYAN